MEKKNAAINFSGGRTSAFMTKWLLQNWSDTYNFIVLFANTGFEHPKTLEFIHNCDNYWNFKTIWLEAKVHKERKGTTYKVTNFYNACRYYRIEDNRLLPNPSQKLEETPFYETILKYGLPNKIKKYCTREMKIRPMTKYAQNYFWTTKYYNHFVGIRADEIDRMSKDKTSNVLYPLVDLGITKKDIDAFWEKQPFNLEIIPRYGNCLTCFQKSDKKLFENYSEHPEWFNLFLEFEKLYPDQTMFRGHRTTQDIIDQAKLWAENKLPKNTQLEIDLECGEGCGI